MNREDFVKLIIEEAGLKPEADGDTCLEQAGFDSIANMITITLIDQHFGKMITAPLLRECKTFNDIYDLANDNSKG